MAVKTLPQGEQTELQTVLQSTHLVKKKKKNRAEKKSEVIGYQGETPCDMGLSVIWLKGASQGQYFHFKMCFCPIGQLIQKHNTIYAYSNLNTTFFSIKFIYLYIKSVLKGKNHDDKMIQLA